MIYQGEEQMIAEFSVFPVGKGESLSVYVAECIKIVEANGLLYQLTPMGTIIEGEIDDVMKVIVDCHKKVMTMSDRVVTNIRIDDRRGAHPMDSKVESVRSKLG